MHTKFLNEWEKEVTKIQNITAHLDLEVNWINAGN